MLAGAAGCAPCAGRSPKPTIEHHAVVVEHRDELELPAERLDVAAQRRHRWVALFEFRHRRLGDFESLGQLDLSHRARFANRAERVHFVSLGIEGDASNWVLDGELTIGEVTRPVKFDVEFGGIESFFDGTRHAGFEATGEIRRKDFDLSFGPLSAMLGDVVKVQLDLQFIEPAA